MQVLENRPQLLVPLALVVLRHADSVGPPFPVIGNILLVLSVGNALGNDSIVNELFCSGRGAGDFIDRLLYAFCALSAWWLFFEFFQMC